jgi:hypothetical protein
MTPPFLRPLRVFVFNLVAPEKVAPQPAAKRPLNGCKPVRSLNASPESQFFRTQEKALKSFLRLNPHPDNEAGLAAVRSQARYRLLGMPTSSKRSVILRSVLSPCKLSHR